jgi:recombinational DNA repair protein RecT
MGCFLSIHSYTELKNIWSEFMASDEELKTQIKEQEQEQRQEKDLEKDVENEDLNIYTDRPFYKSNPATPCLVLYTNKENGNSKDG